MERQTYSSTNIESMSNPRTDQIPAIPQRERRESFRQTAFTPGSVIPTSRFEPTNATVTQAKNSWRRRSESPAPSSSVNALRKSRNALLQAASLFHGSNQKHSQIQLSASQYGATTSNMPKESRYYAREEVTHGKINDEVKFSDTYQDSQDDSFIEPFQVSYGKLNDQPNEIESHNNFNRSRRSSFNSSQDYRRSASPHSSRRNNFVRTSPISGRTSRSDSPPANDIHSRKSFERNERRLSSSRLQKQGSSKFSRFPQRIRN